MSPSEEKDTLDRFHKIYPQFPKGNISQPDKPDFIVTGEIRVGIEVTQVFVDQENPGGSLIRAKDTFRRNLLSNIVDALKKSQFPNCIFAISLSDEEYSKQLSAHLICNACLPEILSKRNIIVGDGHYLT
jgi:hypothetical protein